MPPNVITPLRPRCCAAPSSHSSLRGLLPPYSGPLASSRLTHKPASPRRRPRRASGSTAVGKTVSGWRGRRLRLGKRRTRASSAVGVRAAARLDGSMLDEITCAGDEEGWPLAVGRSPSAVAVSDETRSNAGTANGQRFSSPAICGFRRSEETHMSRSRKARPRTESAAAASAPTPAASKPKRPQSLADYLRRQRSLADISLRKIIERSGIPGVVLRELEGGLQNPSQTLLQSLAGALRLSAETLYLQAGVLDPKDIEESDAVRELRRDPHLTERQRETVVEVYKAFRRANQTPAE